MNQLFTCSYNPQKKWPYWELSCGFGKKLRPFNFWSMDELDGVLTLFYEKYNNKRLHPSVCNLPPNIFIECWSKGLVEQKRDEIKRTITFKLKISYNLILGTTSLKRSSLQNVALTPFLVYELNFHNNAIPSPETSLQTSV
jgi:putative transposase